MVCLDPIAQNNLINERNDLNEIIKTFRKY